MSSYRLPDGSVPVLLSSDTPEGLRREAAVIADYVAEHDEVAPDRIADMIFRTRVARRYRALVMATGRESLLAALRAVAAGEPHSDVVSSGQAATARRIAYVFPGQGSQRPGMGRMLYDHSEAYRAAVEECDKVFHELYSWSPLPYLLDVDAPADDSARTVQPALFMQMVGVAAMWAAVGVRPAATVGHSQGEIAAAYVSGAQTLRDAARIVTSRATIVDGLQLTGFSMAVVGIDRDECEDLLARHAGFAELSVVNSPHILAISGERAAVLAIVELLNAAGKFAKEIRVQYPAHTSYVSGFRDELNATVGDDMDNESFLDSEIDFIGATLGDRVGSDLPIIDYWYLNLRNRVRFDRAIAIAAERGADTFLEISEHPTLMLAIQENLAGVTPQRSFQALGTSRRSAEDLREFTRSLATVAVHDAGFRWDALRVSASGGAVALPLLDFPNTRMTPKTLWAPYPYEAAGSAPRRAAGEHATDGTVVPQRYAEHWTRLSRRKMVPPRTLALVDHTGRCADLVSSICAAAPRLGATVVYTDETGAPTAAFDTLVVLLPRPEGDGVATAVDDIAEFLGDRAWLADLSGVTDVWLVTTGGEQVLETDVPDPFHAAAQAGFRCLAAEHIGVTFRHLDLAAGTEPAAAAKGLVESLHTAGEPELAVRDGGVYAKRLIVDDTAADAPLDAADLREVVIVGGTGKLGLDFCERFAAAGAGRITLVSRTGGDPAAVQRVRDIQRSSKTEIARRTCDVGDEAAVRALAGDFRDTPATLIVHAAVDYSAAEAVPTPETIRAAALAKTVALDHLVRHVPLAADGRIVLCSSLSATLGGRGHMVYSAVNRLLDAAAAHYRAEGVRCSSVQWGLWRAVGADNAEALAKISGTGLLPMEPKAAVAAGFAPDAANVLVAAAEWGRIRELYTVFGYQNLFAELPDEPVDAAETANPAAAEADTEVQAVLTPVRAAPRDTAETVRDALRTVMGLGSTESIDGSIPLVALGLDSLQALDLRKRVESDLKRDLPVTAILGGASLDEVVSLLA
ncbi:mycobactin polyketide synthetase MbtD [Nocardia transvalensis]|uniref:Mycobactin polyketide synthetase MbtD n=1 Tax=Nocardia transvalensis TaxID=37333 RepID=A0A7W9UH24_9NOCA|nr:nocobactin polyketide synthase NbtC [Nocardia transvalensis]MBB5912904.1 mycobactin polyketide synthetase MbtD [Nocardia transvalensis]